MQNEYFDCISNLISPTYSRIAENNRKSFSNRMKILLNHKKIPEHSFSELEIQIILQEFSNMDFNNATAFTGMGEREGRVYSNIVRNRHFGFSHGIGRSGDLTANQPKAPGSSIVNKLTNSLVLHLVHEMGLKSAKGVLLVPMATGMTLTLCMLSLRKHRPTSAKYIIWSRIDQKSAFKSILTAGFEPIIIDPISVGDELQTDVDMMERHIAEKGAESILCIMTTTSCFAPRVPDNITKVTALCRKWKIPQLVNNAYGLTLRRCMNVLQQACCGGSVDQAVSVETAANSGEIFAIVQSTDKNLMVPVGGAIVASPNKHVIESLASLYPGRASGSPGLDVFVTLLQLGLEGMRGLVQQRESNFQYLRQCIFDRWGPVSVAGEVTEERGTPEEDRKMKPEEIPRRPRLMMTEHNPVSLAIDISGLADSSLGSQLFHRGVSGCRVVQSAKSNPGPKLVEGHSFIGWGSSHSQSQCDYINVAAAIGQSRQEIDRCISLLVELLNSKVIFRSTKLSVKGDL